MASNEENMGVVSSWKHIGGMFPTNAGQKKARIMKFGPVHVEEVDHMQTEGVKRIQNKIQEETKVIQKMDAKDAGVVEKVVEAVSPQPKKKESGLRDIFSKILKK